MSSDHGDVSASRARTLQGSFLSDAVNPGSFGCALLSTGLVGHVRLRGHRLIWILLVLACEAVEPCESVPVWQALSQIMVLCNACKNVSTLRKKNSACEDFKTRASKASKLNALYFSAE